MFTKLEKVKVATPPKALNRVRGRIIARAYIYIYKYIGMPMHTHAVAHAPAPRTCAHSHMRALPRAHSREWSRQSPGNYQAVYETLETTKAMIPLQTFNKVRGRVIARAYICQCAAPRAPTRARTRTRTWHARLCARAPLRARSCVRLRACVRLRMFTRARALARAHVRASACARSLACGCARTLARACARLRAHE